MPGCISPPRWGCTRTATSATRRSASWSTVDASTDGRSTCTPRDVHRPIEPTRTRSGRSRSRCSSRSTRSASGRRAGARPSSRPHVRPPFGTDRGAALLPSGGRAGDVRLHAAHPVRGLGGLDRGRRRVVRPRARRDVGIARPFVGRASGRRTRPSGCPRGRPAVLLAVGTRQLRGVLHPLRRQRAVRRPALARDGRRRHDRHR